MTVILQSPKPLGEKAPEDRGRGDARTLHFRRLKIPSATSAIGLGMIVCLVLFVRLFWDSFGHFYYHWTNDENYSHGFLVPLISLYFASQVFRRGAIPIRGGTELGCLFFAVALAVRLFTVVVPIPFVARSCSSCCDGGPVCRPVRKPGTERYWFAFFFLIFMIPLPVALYSKIASPLQLLASRVAATVMNASGVPVLREGNKMTLPGGTQLFVAEACSGVRQLTGFLALTTAVAYLEHPTDLVSGRRDPVGFPHCALGQHRACRVDGLRHALSESAVRIGRVSYAGRVADDGLRAASSQSGVLGVASNDLPRIARRSPSRFRLERN